jgi:3-hydroxyacyl-CoA dehydrogenase
MYPENIFILGNGFMGNGIAQACAYYPWLGQVFATDASHDSILTDATPRRPYYGN